MASSYGKGPYGNRLYSWAPTVDFNGDVTPSVSFSGTIDILVAQGDLAGNLRPAIVLGASLAADRVLAGSIDPQDRFGRQRGLWALLAAFRALSAAALVAV